MGQIYQFKAIDNIFAILDIPEDVVKIIYKYYMTMMRNKNLIKCHSDTFDMLYEHRRYHKIISANMTPYTNYDVHKTFLSTKIKVLLNGLNEYQEVKKIRTFTCHMCMRERFVSKDACGLKDSYLGNCEGDNCYFNNGYHNNMPLICDICMEYNYHDDDEDLDITYCRDRCIRGNPELIDRLHLINYGLKCGVCDEICDPSSLEESIEICCNDEGPLNICENCESEFINCYECNAFIDKNSSCGEEIKGIDYCCDCKKKPGGFIDSQSDSDSDDSVISGC